MLAPIQITLLAVLTKDPAWKPKATFAFHRVVIQRETPDGRVVVGGTVTRECLLADRRVPTTGVVAGKRIVTHGCVLETHCISCKRSITEGVVARSGCVSIKRESADRIVEVSGQVRKESSLADSIVARAAGIVQKCLKPNGCVGVGLVDRESLLANRSVFPAGAVVMEREKTVRCVSVGTDVVRKRPMAGRNLESEIRVSRGICPPWSRVRARDPDAVLGIVDHSQRRFVCFR
jgi:hypothetical protein